MKEDVGHLVLGSEGATTNAPSRRPLALRSRPCGAHHILTFIIHLYLQGLSLTAPTVIPAPIGIQSSRVLRSKYSDTVTYNEEWKKALLTYEMETELGQGYTLDPVHLKSQDPFEGTDTTSHPPVSKCGGWKHSN